MITRTLADAEVVARFFEFQEVIRRRQFDYINDTRNELRDARSNFISTLECEIEDLKKLCNEEEE